MRTPNWNQAAWLVAHTRLQASLHMLPLSLLAVPGGRRWLLCDVWEDIFFQHHHCYYYDFRCNFDDTHHCQHHRRRHHYLCLLLLLLLRHYCYSCFWCCCYCCCCSTGHYHEHYHDYICSTTMPTMARIAAWCGSLRAVVCTPSLWRRGSPGMAKQHKMHTCSSFFAIPFAC